MKRIASLQGVCAIQYSYDEASPTQGALTRDVIPFIGETYKFAAIPQVPPQLMVLPMQDFTFQVGEVLIDDKKIPINQLSYLFGGLIVTTKDTDTADAVAKHIAAKLDERFEFTITKSVRATYYLSDLIVEFTPSLEEQVSVFAKVKSILEKEIPRSGTPFDVKRLAFGSVQVPVLALPSHLENLLNEDFTIERRAGEPRGSNRYYSRAPLKTVQHEKVLAAIEEAIRD
jgi:hypothetical protein